MTRQIRVGGVPIGGGAPVTIQSMTNTRTDDVSATAEQIKRLAAAGCEIVRVAVPDLAAARAVGAIRERSPIPLVADIHFDYRLALECVAAGCDKVRINPGNIGGEDRVKAVADACRQKGIPIRIGVNGGSLEKPILAKYRRPWWSRPLDISACWRNLTLPTYACPSSPPACAPPWRPTA